MPSEPKGVSGIDGPVSTYLNRPFSRRISGAVARLPISADQWSWTSFVAVCTGACALAAGRSRTGGLLIHIGSVLDGVDGEVARLQGTAGPAGALLDLVLDRVSDVAVVAGLAVGAGARRTDWMLALAAANGLLVSGIIKERIGAEHESVSGLQEIESGRARIDALLPWTGRDGRLLAAALAGIAGVPRIGLVWLAVTTNIRLCRRAAAALAILRQQARRGPTHS
ncbi:MAG: CDP-alcohol phosphatidyltransferase family protein [Chloroflexota bacterium]